MNIERWLSQRRPTWQKLEDLLIQIDRYGLRRLQSEELQALGKLYRAASADLSRARALNISTEIVGYLNNLVVRAHNQVYQRKSNRLMSLGRFFWISFPELVRQNMAYIITAFAIFAIPLLGCWMFVLKDISVAHLELAPGKPLIPEELWNMIEHKQMWTDMVQYASPAVSSWIATNNIQVAVLAFVLGITFGLGTVFILVLNGILLGCIGGACQTYGMVGSLALFAAPHGVLELPAIFISGGAGLILGKALLFPGDYRRLDAMRIAAPTAFKLFAGCVPLLLLAGAIEGFVSPRTDLLPAIKYTVAAAAFACLLSYLFLPRTKTPKP